MSTLTGKITHHFFERFILGKCGKKRNEVSVGPKFGVDVSVIDLPGGLAMCLTSDPLSLIPSLGLEESAWLSVHLMANDMATTGFAPQYGQFVLNLPPHLSTSDFQTYWGYIHRFCNDIGVAITGGHTGFFPGQESTVAGGGTFITVAQKDKILVSEMAQPGNIVLVTKSAAISAAAILAMSFPETVKTRAGAEAYHKGCELFYKTSSLMDGLAAVGENLDYPEVTAMHDVTEGGILGAIYELATASGCGAFIENEKLPLGEIQQQVCNIFSLDQRYCIGAGAMVIACRKEAAQNVIKRLENEGIQCTEVGYLTDEQQGMKLKENDIINEIIYVEKDPYWNAFFKAFNAGWK